MNNERFVTQSVTWVEVGVRDYVLAEHLQRPDNQGDAALRWATAKLVKHEYQIDFFIYKLVNGIENILTQQMSDIN